MRVCVHGVLAVFALLLTVLVSFARSSPGEVVLQYFVLFVCVGSALACVAAILAELSASFAYYGRAFRHRYIGQKKIRLRSEAEAKAELYHSKRAKLLAVLCCKRQRRGGAAARLRTSQQDGVVMTMPGQLVQKSLSSMVNPLHPSVATSRKDSLFDTSAATMRRYADETKGVSLAGVGHMASARHVMSKEEVAVHREKMMQFVESARKESVRADACWLCCAVVAAAFILLAVFGCCCAAAQVSGWFSAAKLVGVGRAEGSEALVFDKAYVREAAVRESHKESCEESSRRCRCVA